jgi:hypothetical protein
VNAQASELMHRIGSLVFTKSLQQPYIKTLVTLQASELMHRIGSLTARAGRDAPASALLPIPRPPSITGRLPARPPSAAGV